MNPSRLITTIMALGIGGTLAAFVLIAAAWAQGLDAVVPIAGKASETLLSTGNVAIAALLLTNIVAFVLVGYLLRRMGKMADDDTKALAESNDKFVGAIRTSSASIELLTATHTRNNEVLATNQTKIYEALVAMKESMSQEAAHVREVVRDRFGEDRASARKPRGSP